MSILSQAAHPVIFDTDPGVDDAMALFYAMAHPAIDLVGITTTFGNVTVQQAVVNALYLTQLCGRSAIPVTQGAAQSIGKVDDEPAAFIHGADGLGNLPMRVPTTRVADPRRSAQFIVDMARERPGEITLVPVGPLGNVAQALQIEPRLPQLLKRVVVMGGSVLAPGNVSPVAEANIWKDPHAADAVFTAGFHLDMVGLDVTYSVVFPMSTFTQMAAHHQHPATDVLLHAVKFYANFYATRFADAAQVGGCYGHDVLAFLYLVHPEFFGTAQGRMRVVTEGIANGQTILNRRPDIDYPQTGWGTDMPNTTACMTVNSAACVAEFERTLLSDWL